MKNTKRDTEKRISPLWIYFQEFMHGIYHKRKSSGGCTERAGYNENQKYRQFLVIYAGHCVLSVTFRSLPEDWGIGVTF